VNGRTASAIFSRGFLARRPFSISQSNQYRRDVFAMARRTTPTRTGTLRKNFPVFTQLCLSPIRLLDGTQSNFCVYRFFFYGKILDGVASRVESSTQERVPTHDTLDTAI
jgi:hypothetical protein